MGIEHGRGTLKPKPESINHPPGTCGVCDLERSEVTRRAIADQRPEWVNSADTATRIIGALNSGLDPRAAAARPELGAPYGAALPVDSKARKEIPMARGLLDYFTAAMAEVAHVSWVGNQKHNPGQEMHHARGKSTDHADCIIRHLAERGTVDPDDGLRHTAKAAWRALALLQEELEAAGAPLARGARK